jgi:ABC-2 type transport system permease protein
MSAVVAVMRRELSRVTSSPYYALLLLVLPLLSFGLPVAIFGTGVPRDLPVVVVDNDNTSLSRQVTRMIDATAGMRVARRAASIAEGRSLVLENQAYAIVLLPADMERDVRRGASPKVAAYYNAQLLLPASLIRRDLRAVVSTASAGLEVRLRQARGDTPRGALEHVEPIRLDAHTLFNPHLNYATFLLAALLPTMLQIFVTVATVHAVGDELKRGTAGEWLAAGGGSRARAVVGKLLPQTLHFGVLAALMHAILFGWMAVPLRGHISLLLAGTVLFVLAYQAIALLAIAWLANLRLATSAAALYCAPAFAFVGVTFPTMAMPPLGRAWAELLPLTHYLRLVTGQAIRGEATASSMPHVAALAAFVVVAAACAWWRVGRVMADPRYWGRQ